MNDLRKAEMVRSPSSARTVLAIAIAGGLVAVACFGDNGSSGDSGASTGGSAGEDGEGGSSGKGKAGNGGTSSGGGGTSGAEGGEGGEDTTGGTSGSAGKGGMGGMSGAGGSGGMPGARCGDTTTDPGEECDDGNTLDGDDCSWNCTLGCAECHQNECPMLGQDVALVIDDCYDDDTLAQGGPAEGIATRGELCRALVSCVHQSGCGAAPDGTIALEECYCAVAFPLCLSAGSFMPGPCKVEYEEAAETTNAQEALTSASDVSRPSGRAFLVLNYCDSEAQGPCHDQCFDEGGGGTSGTGGMGGAGTGGGGAGGRAGMGGGGMGGAGMGGAGMGGAGTGGISGSGGVSAVCGDGMTSGSEECDGGGNPYLGTSTCSNDCRLTTSPACSGCEVESGYCNGIATCRDVTSAAGRAACYDLAECIYDNRSCVGLTAEACYCGSVATSTCGTLPAYPAATAPNGPCARQFEAAMETNVPSTVLVNFNNASVPGSRVVQRTLCDVMFCSAECF